MLLEKFGAAPVPPSALRQALTHRYEIRAWVWACMLVYNHVCVHMFVHNVIGCICACACECIHVHMPGSSGGGEVLGFKGL